MIASAEQLRTQSPCPVAVPEAAHVVLGDPLGMSGAVFGIGDQRETHRLFLWRNFVVAPARPLLFCMLNPSTADAFRLDATVTRNVARTKRLDCDALWVVNMYGARSTDPNELVGFADPVGNGNDAIILAAAGAALRVIAGWGQHAMARRRHADALALLTSVADVDVLRLTKRAQMPEHPLYLPNDLQPIRYRTKGDGR